MNRLFTELENQIQGFSENTISSERKELLWSLIDYLQLKTDANQDIKLNFICTHNSRRSHLAQIWAQTMAFYFRIKNVQCYSGGTEATAMFQKVTETLLNQGFSISKLSAESNPIYSIKFSENEHPVIGFSKIFDAEFNPKSNFAAIMTCSQADEGCPFIAGAEKRFAIRYEDPKLYDATDLQNEKYLERSIEIGTEMKYVFSQIKQYL
jgi:arsenate reductase